MRKERIHDVYLHIRQKRKRPSNLRTSGQAAGRLFETALARWFGCFMELHDDHVKCMYIEIIIEI